MFLTEHGFRSRELNGYQRDVPDGRWNQIVRIELLAVMNFLECRIFIRIVSEKKIRFVTNENEKSSLFLWNDRQAANRKRHVTISTACSVEQLEGRE